MKHLFSSDHSPFFVKSSTDLQPKHELKTPLKLKHDFASFAYKKANWNEINQFIIDHPFDPYCKSNVDLMVDLWYEWLYVILQDFLTIKTKHRVTLAPWVGNESCRLIKKLNTLQKSYRTKGKPALKTEVEETQTKLTLSLQNDQFNHETKLFHDSKFSALQRYLKSISRTNGTLSEIHLEQNVSKDDYEKAELFNQYFQSVVSQTDYGAQIDHEKEPKLRCLHFSPNENKTAILKLDVNKALGPDHINNALLKNLAESLPKSLSFIFIFIANKAVFPAKWKVSVIVPIFKEGDNQTASNYRPISLLSAVSKLLEKLYFDRISPVIYSKLSPNQHGFRPKRSTISNLIEFFHHLYAQLDSPSCSNLTAFYIDFQKAFDKFSLQRLLEKLSKVGIGHNCLNLIRSYLEQRRQTVKVNDQMSNELPVLSGVPRGSLLGPLFFLVYMNDLPDVIMSTNFGYADDFKVIRENPVTLNIDVRRIYKWCSDNFMSMNLAKSKYVAIKGCATVSLNNYTKKLRQWKTSEFYFLKTYHGHLMLRKEQRQLSKPFTVLNETYQKLHLSIENMHISLMLSQSSATHRPYGCPRKET